MSRNRRTAFRSSRASRATRAIAVAAALTAFATACTHSSGTSHAAPSQAPTTDTPGQVTVHEADVDLTITDAVAHLDSAGNGTLTMAVRNDSGVPEHLDMVGTPDAGRGAIAGAGKSGAPGSLMDAGIYLPDGTTVTFGGTGPTVTFSAVHGVTAAHTLPLMLQFGVARLVHLSARVVTTG
ncbi:hypothetical protein [Streptomyces sp. NBC_00448]|uniref:hypothetical protein n=1 Tax=Streptomyces sp. NBC_00448 TaxID=2903652 RepID=UPI002E1A2906